MCHNNIFEIKDSKLYDLSFDCENPKIDRKLISKVGFGRTFDDEGNLYVVRLYFSNQKGKLDINAKYFLFIFQFVLQFDN